MDTGNVNETIQDLSTLFHSRMEEFEKALHQHTVTSVPGAQLQTVKALSADYQQFKSFVVKAISALKMQLDQLNNGMDRLETHSRRKVLLLHGLPEDSKENAATKVHEVFKKMKLTQFHPDCIETCHRLGATKNDRTRPVLIRFTTYRHRATVWNSKTALKGTRISLSEFLTKSRQNIFSAARKHFSLKNCWTSDGTIVVQLPDKSRHKITSYDELQHLQARFPSTTGS